MHHANASTTTDAAQLTYATPPVQSSSNPELQSFSSAVSQSLHLQHMDTLQTSHKMNCNWDGEIQKYFTISFEDVVYSYFTVFCCMECRNVIRTTNKNKSGINDSQNETNFLHTIMYLIEHIVWSR